ncbi:xanthine dehydrogenase small subunit [Neiella marina]|uniref:Xanthine dehydrogenase small subunit n=1 Tax=Neiella holothuriorum TaxID=2870530 RepID=A0ABS7EBV0_9GAMM|nr:xanthine dehydrogenase small subunit [Neiella holothuriorum]MBW8189799.1 xanthine dehydrogenase small subunit [Neiella holothuriorum]
MALYVNDQAIDISQLPADTSLLQLLRQQQLTGTKEGCASGDCGACTVMVIDGCHKTPNVKAINSCICPVSSLQNQQVVTVEGLSQGPASELHPTQQAMVECHGSQCGFCTPGFVMSIAALKAKRPDLASAPLEQQRQAVLDAISGNLCRCTGYRPIVAAGCQSLEKPAQPFNFVHGNDSSAPCSSTTSVQKADQTYLQPNSEVALQQAMTNYPSARLIAGGTDLMLEVTQQFQPIEQLIDISQVAELTQTTFGDDTILIGAAVTYTELEQQFAELAPEFVALLHRLGSRQIRNRGTLGGNICNASPIADTPPVLLALNAQLHLVNAAGQRRQLPLSEFYLGYKQTAMAADEYLAAIEVRRAALNQPIRLYKVSKRYEDDISAVMAAFSLTPEGQLTIAFGGMAATPIRAVITEKSLQLGADGQFDPSMVTAATVTLANEFSPLSDVRASADYRTQVAANLLKKACLELCQPALAIGVFAHA